jgi:transposase
MYVDESTSIRNGKEYKRVLLRESYREKGKVKKRTIANLSKCSKEEIEAIKLALKHKKDLKVLGSIKKEIRTKTGASVGAILLLYSLAKRLHIARALGNTREGRLALWQVMVRIINQGSRFSAVRLTRRHAICELLGLDSFNEDDLYKNLDWLCDNQRKIEKKLFKERYQRDGPSNLYLYDVTSSYLEGGKNELADWGKSRDGKKGKQQIIIGLLTDGEGIPVSVEVFKGNTSDVKTFLNQIKKLAYHFEIAEVTIVGDRGMIKSSQIEGLNEANFHYITAITKPQIRKLIKERYIQLELFTERLCELEVDGVRYILRRNPIRVEEIKRARDEKVNRLIKFTEEVTQYLAEHKRAKVNTAGKRIGRLMEKLKLSEFCELVIKGRCFSIERDVEKEEKLFCLDGCYVIKTDLSKEKASKEQIHERYKDLSLVEEAFRTMKTGFLEIRPIFVRKEKRTRGHVFVVMLAYIITKELERLWSGMDIKVKEGIEELAGLRSILIKVKGTSFWQIPEPTDLGAALLESANVSLPEILPFRGIKVDIRKKLTTRRKKQKNQQNRTKFFT